MILKIFWDFHRSNCCCRSVISWESSRKHHEEVDEHHFPPHNQTHLNTPIWEFSSRTTGKQCDFDFPNWLSNYRMSSNNLFNISWVLSTCPDLGRTCVRRKKSMGVDRKGFWRSSFVGLFKVDVINILNYLLC